MRGIRIWLAVILAFGSLSGAFLSSVSAGVGPKGSIPRLSVIEETEIHIFKDHRSKVKFKGAYRVQTEDGQVPKMRLLSFDKNDMRLNQFKAWTMNGNERTEVPPSMIQWTPVSEEAGFSSYVSLEAAFPRMNVGSTIRWEYEIEETQVPVLGFFSYLYRLDSEYHSAEGFRFTVTSELPLQTWNNDPNEVFEITPKGNGFEARLKKAISHHIVNETYGVLSQNRFPTLFVSTAKDWASIGKELQKKYELRLNEPMSPLVKEIANKVKLQKGFFAQVKELNRLLGDQIRYMGDWRGRHSGQVPRSIAAISESQFGDCKDFSLLATLVLRSLGYRANFASVYSDRIPVPDFYYNHPNNYFNHQIVHVKLGRSEYWIDPTSQDDISLVDDSLANRQALVWGKVPELRKIASYSEKNNGFRYHLVMSPLSQRRFSGDLEIESWGLESKFAHEENNVENPMIRWMTIFFPDIKATSQEFHMHSPRTPKPWAHRGRGLGAFEDVFDKTPMGDGLRLGYSGFMRALLDVNESWISDFDFGFPSERRYEVEFKNRHFVMSGAESCKIKSPWLNIEVSVKNRNDSGFLTYSEVFKVTEIPNQKLKTNDFRSLQSQIRSCLASRILILRHPNEMKPQRRGLASEPDMSIQLKKVGMPSGMAKYYSKKLTPLREPMPKRVAVVGTSVASAGKDLETTADVGQAKPKSAGNSSPPNPPKAKAGESSAAGVNPQASGKAKGPSAKKSASSVKPKVKKTADKAEVNTRKPSGKLKKK